MGDHVERSVGGFGPLIGWLVPIELYAVLIGVAEIDCFADAVIGGAVERNAGAEHAPQGVGQLGAFG